MRKSGVLMNISSLSNPYGIGSMGACAREFVDFLKKSGQSYWQVLPICPTSYGDSPYQSFCCEAGNPYFVDLDLLAEKGLLKKEDYASIDWCSKPDSINYGVMYNKRYPVLHKAAAKFLENPDTGFEEFLEKNAYWIENYALFMAMKDSFGGCRWLEWDEEYRNREPQALSNFEQENQEAILFWKAIQYLFYEQWYELKAFANENGIKIIGDLPIYVSLDSADAWAHPELFQLDENHVPKEISGCPPDGFTADGQLWGNPLYDWDYMKEEGFSWWIRRIDYLCKVFDILRIDHFRGFESYYAIPYGDKNAKNGQWRKGPGIALFQKVEEALGRRNIIAEDLGYLTPEVHQLLADSGYPGMSVLEFAFDSRDASDNLYLPHNNKENMIAYVGTHDNDTAEGWYDSLIESDRNYAKAYMGLNEEEGVAWGMMRNLWISDAMITIVQAQDLLELGHDCRMNTPSTLGENWKWRALPGVFTDELAEKLHEKTRIYGRL